MSPRRTAVLTSACAVLLLAAGCSSDGSSDDAIVSPPTAAAAGACQSAEALGSAITVFEDALVPGATENSLELATSRIEIAMEALDATVPVDQRDAYRAVERAEDSLDSALDRLPEVGAYSQDQVDSVADEVAAFEQAQQDLVSALGC